MVKTKPFLVAYLEVENEPLEMFKKGQKDLRQLVILYIIFTLDCSKFFNAYIGTAV